MSTRLANPANMTLASFRRITGSGRYLPEVDGLRCIAILSVIFLHCYAEVLDQTGLGVFAMQNQQGLLRLLSHGGYGVQVFFAISGFILALPFARHHLQSGRPVGLSAYFVRRITRLEPPYILWLLIRSMLLLAATALPFHFVLVHLAASALYIHNIAFGISSRIEAVSWSLEIEVQFYCLVPLFTSIYKISSRGTRRALLATMIAIATPLQKAYLPGWEGPLNAGIFNLSIFSVIQYFLVGLLVADLYVDGWDRIVVSRWWDVASLVLWPLMFWLPLNGFRYAGPIILTILFVGAFKSIFVRRILRQPLISVVGGMCYSIYLTHRTSIALSQRLLMPFHMSFKVLLLASLFVGTVVSIVAGAAYFRLIERPCMDPQWPQKLWARFRRDPPNPPPGSSSRGREIPNHTAGNDLVGV